MKYSEDYYTNMQLETLARNPLMSNFRAHSALRTMYEVFALMLGYTRTLIDTAKDQNFVPTAYGADLDRLVIDRIPEGRRQGSRATGYVTFRRVVLTYAVTIPSGTQLAAVNSTGSIIFETTESAVIVEGETTVDVPVRAVDLGSKGNVGRTLINRVVNGLPGIDVVTNFMPLSGGSDQENDRDLQIRYTYMYNTVGAATTEVIQNALASIEGVAEGKLSFNGPGLVDVVVDGGDPTTSEVTEVLISKMAGGVICNGIEVLRIANGVSALTDYYSIGAHAYFVPTSFVDVGGTITGTANLDDDTQKAVSFVIPNNTPAWTPIPATISPASAMICSVEDDFTVISGLNGSVFLGLGTWPYLWNLPDKMPVNIHLTIEFTDFSEEGIAALIGQSQADWLSSFLISQDVEWSDSFHFALNKFDKTQDEGVGRTFKGIKSIDALTLTANGVTIDGPHETLIALPYWKFKPGDVFVNGAKVYTGL